MHRKSLVYCVTHSKCLINAHNDNTYMDTVCCSYAPKARCRHLSFSNWKIVSTAGNEKLSNSPLQLFWGHHSRKTPAFAIGHSGPGCLPKHVLRSHLAHWRPHSTVTSDFHLVAFNRHVVSFYKNVRFPGLYTFNLFLHSCPYPRKRSKEARKIH
jgi:hypothetical protein